MTENPCEPPSSSSPIESGSDPLVVRRDGETLTLEWDNRQVKKSRGLSLFFAVFWCFWAPATAFVTWALVQELAAKEVDWFNAICSTIWLLFGYAGTILIPSYWLLRRSVERVEIDNNRYRHYHVTYPWMCPRDWAISDLTSITYGHSVNDDGDSFPGLAILGPNKTDQIAYWADEAFHLKLLEALRQHLEDIDSPLEVMCVSQS